MPDEPTIGDTKPATVPAAPAAPAAVPVAPTFDPKEVERLKGIESTYNQFVDVLRTHGIKTHEDLSTSLKTVGAINRNDELKGVIAALLGSQAGIGQPPAKPAPATATGTPDVRATVLEVVTELLNQRDKVRSDAEWNDGLAQESSLKAKVFGDPRFKKIVGAATFDDAWAGKNGHAPKNLALIIDQLFYERGAKNASGTYRPVTDAVVLKEVADEAVAIYNAVRAQTILDSSQEPTKPEAPDGGSPGDATPFQVVLGNDYNPERQAKESAAVADTFEKAYRQAMANMGGLPASQAV